MPAAGYLVHRPHCAHLRHEQCRMQGAPAWCLTPCKADSAPITSHDVRTVQWSATRPAPPSLSRSAATTGHAQMRACPATPRGADACPAAQASSHAQRRRRLPQCACQRPGWSLEEGGFALPVFLRQRYFLKGGGAPGRPAPASRSWTPLTPGRARTRLRLPLPSCRQLRHLGPALPQCSLLLKPRRETSGRQRLQKI